MVGSGAGGGVVAGELAERGRKVLLLEAGGHYVPLPTSCAGRAGRPTTTGGRSASRMPAGDFGLGPIVMISGRCVGGSTTINTKVALRATQRELDKWHAATGLTNAHGGPDLEPPTSTPTTTASSATSGVRDRATDWDLKRCVQTAKKGFEAVGATLEPVRVVRRRELRAVRLVPAGLPDERRQVDDEHLHPAQRGSRERSTVRPNSFVERVLIEDRDDRSRGDRRASTPTRPPAKRHESTPTSWWSRPDRCARPRS